MMPIDFACICGKSYRAKDKLAGQFFRCRNCGHEAIVPGVRAGAAPSGTVSTFIPSADEARFRLHARHILPRLMPTPMNSVGLFSLLISLLCYSLTGLWPSPSSR